MPDVDPHVVLGFALAASPQSYAVLLGAGMSISAGVPTAWDVEQDLLARLARQRSDETPDDLEAWYAETFGQDPSYDHLLGAVAKTTYERQALLKAYFEPPDADPPRPSSGHLALACLVASGHVRVILTTNFDRLMESALHAEGVEPVVVSSPESAVGLAPLHLLRCLVVHLHGDYLTPASMLNTTAELARYAPAMDALVDRVLDDYGLAIIGWSGKWDQALRAALQRRMNLRYSTYWVDPGALAPKALELAARLEANYVQETADEFLGHLRDAVGAVNQSTTDPRTLQSAVAAAKRELGAGPGPAIPLHDRLRREHDATLAAAIRCAESRDDTGPTQLRAQLEAASEIYLGLVATTAYWGTPATDTWWLTDLPRLAEPSRDSGSTLVLKLRQVPALFVLHAAGTALVAAGRWDALARLLDERVTFTDQFRGAERPVFCMSPGEFLGLQLASGHLHTLLADTFAVHLALGRPAYADAWERFEYLRLLATTDWQLRKESGYGSDTPHIRVTGTHGRYRASPADWLDTVITDAKHPLFVGGAFEGSLANLTEAREKYDQSFAAAADSAAWRSNQGIPFWPTPFYLDERLVNG